MAPFEIALQKARNFSSEELVGVIRILDIHDPCQGPLWTFFYRDGKGVALCGGTAEGCDTEFSSGPNVGESLVELLQEAITLAKGK